MPVVRTGSDIGVNNREDPLPGNSIDTVDPIVEREELQSLLDVSDGIGGEVDPISSVEVPDQTVVTVEQPVVPSPVVQPTESRPVRTRKPNVRYNAKEYDLSKVSGTKKVITDRGWKKAKRRCELSP